MGTRHLTAVVLDGDYKVAQYGQWDGYLEGQGETIRLFFESLTPKTMNKFREAIAKCSFMSDEEYDRIFKSFGRTSDFGMTMEEAEKYKASEYGYLSRDTGAAILSVIYERNGVPLVNTIDFAADSLFCEWAYVINLDNDTLEIYEGFNESPVPASERFACYNDKAREGYYPVKLYAVVPLKELPKLAMNKEGLSGYLATKTAELEAPDSFEVKALEEGNRD